MARKVKVDYVYTGPLPQRRMKSRRVVVQLEIDTNARLSALKDKKAWMLLPDVKGHDAFDVHQISVNVVKK